MTERGGRHANGDLSQPPKRKPRLRRYLALDALVSVVVIGLAAVTVLVLRGGTTDNSRTPVAAAAAKLRADTTVTKGSKWLDGSGARLLTAVNADLGQVSAAEHAGSHAAARAAGARLAADASAALAGPTPPVDATLYRSALKDLWAAGSDEAAGKSGQAARPLAAGEAGIMTVTAAADRPVAVKMPAIPEPNGQ